MSKFEAITQFSPEFKEIGNFNQERSACPLFALITCYNYMSGSSDETNSANLTKESHEQNLFQAITSYVEIRDKIPQFLNFEELLNFAFGESFKLNNIQASSPELVRENIIGYKQFFPYQDQNQLDKYCTIFLKDFNFFVVLVDNKEGLYYVRDCHREDQYNFTSLEDLTDHLNKEYRMATPTIVDGLAIPEFDNIEFLVVDQPFILGL